MMSNIFLTKSAVMLFLFRVEDEVLEILLQKRKNTGYMDGMWDCAVAGHVEAGESMKMAVQREAKEEIGIDIELEDIHFATMAHKFTAETGEVYYNGYFHADIRDQVPTIMEPEKCEALQWFNYMDLPKDFITDRQEALYNLDHNIAYDEIGWTPV